MGSLAPALAGRDRAEQAAACRTYLDAAHATLAAAHHAGAAGDVTARGWAAAADAVVRALFGAARAAHPGFEVALVAVGGYGRAELCPASDLDVWFIVPSGPLRDGRAQALAEAVLYPLWDLRLEVGHAVRTVDEVVALARDDLTAATSLLDARFLDGDRALYEQLESATRRYLDKDADGLVRRLVDEKHERHARFGDTVYLLEPNLKNGQGAYRDLMVGLWAAKARFRVRDFPELVAAGQASARQAAALTDARRFQLQLRIATHLHARRRADRLTFELQEAVAPALFPDARDPGETAAIRPAVAPAVEALMQRYFLHAKAVQRETTRLVERAAGGPRRTVVKPIDDDFALVDGRVAPRDAAAFAARPAAWVRLFNVAVACQAGIASAAAELIADGVAHTPLDGDAAAAAELWRLIRDDRDAGAPSLLEQAHDLGLVAAILPEFAPCTARVQHDLYHVFTVDQHSLYALGRLKALARGELAEELPVATDAIGEVERRAPLYLGTLLHDVGKPLGKGHSESGARLATPIARRLGLADADVSQTEFLVRKHLLLSHLSQRRDLNDVAMIANLAEELKDAESLRELYLLTVADMSMVAPGNLTEWKEQLLTELYQRALSHYDTGRAPTAADERTLMARRRARVAELLGEPAAAPAMNAWFDSLPERYLTATAPRDQARHVLLSRRRRGPVAVEVEHHPRRSTTTLTVCADDAPGLLSKIAGVLLANRIDVLDAQIHSRATGEALDVFTTRDRYGRAITDPKRWARVEADLGAVLRGELAVAQLVIDRREKSGLPERITPAVRTEVEVDNEVSAEFSVVDVYTQDRLGVLYTITGTLAGLGLDIRLSKVATEADRVADVFYVRERSGGKLTADRVDEVQLALGEALGALQAR